MTDQLRPGRATGGPVHVEVDITLPEFWTANELGAEELGEAEGELRRLLAEKVDDPEGVARETVEDFMGRIGGGSAPMMVASFREELDDDSVLSASLVVSKNDLTGALRPWMDAYPDAEEVMVAGAPALRASEASRVELDDLFDGPVTVVTWRYVVPFGPRSTLMFAFSSPNGEVGDVLLEHFDEIMAGVEIVASTADA